MRRGLEDLLARMTGLDSELDSDRLLLDLLGHVAAADGVLTDTELLFLHRVKPGHDSTSIKTWVKGLVERPLDVRALAKAITRREDRIRALRFAIRMAWKDGDVGAEERQLLYRAAKAFDLPNVIVDDLARDMVGRTTNEIDSERLLTALVETTWRGAKSRSGELSSNALRAVVPDGSRPLARVLLSDRGESLAFFNDGIAGMFQEGPGYLRWRDMVCYTRYPILGAAVEFVTEDGQSWHLVDARLAVVCTILDAIFGQDRVRPQGVPPRIDVLRD